MHVLQVVQDTVGRHDTFGLACTSVSSRGNVLRWSRASALLCRYGIPRFECGHQSEKVIRHRTCQLHGQFQRCPIALWNQVQGRMVTCEVVVVVRPYSRHRCVCQGMQSIFSSTSRCPPINNSLLMRPAPAVKFVVILGSHGHGQATMFCCAH